MAIDIRNICESGNHYWYPEIRKQVECINQNPLKTVEIDLKNLYVKKPRTCTSKISATVSKIFHNLKMFFSKNYRNRFNYSVGVLIHSVRRLNAVLIMQRATRKHFFKERINHTISEKKEKEKVKQEAWDNAIAICKKNIQRRKVQKPFIILRNQIRKTTSQINHEADVINILAQYLDCKNTLKNLDLQKPKGLKAWVPWLAGESAENQLLRVNTKERIKNLNLQIENNVLIDAGFKNKVKEENEPEKVIEAITLEKNNHEKMIGDCRNVIEKAKLDLIALVPA